MHLQKFFCGNVHNEIHVLRQLRDKAAAKGKTSGICHFRAVKKDPAPAGRISPGGTLDISQKLTFAGTGRADQTDNVTRAKHDGNVFGPSVFVRSSDDLQTAYTDMSIGVGGVKSNQQVCQI